jgi:outer membrane protein TolC
MSRRVRTRWVLAICGAIILSGCGPSQPAYLRGKNGDGHDSHYLGMATALETPDIEADRLNEVSNALTPLTIANQQYKEIWDLTLEEAVKLALANSKVMRNLGGGLFQVGIAGQNAPLTGQGNPGSTQLVQSPGSFQTIYNPSITESDRNTGVEAALSQFDAQVLGQLNYTHTDSPQNIRGAFTGFLNPVLQQDVGQFSTTLGKVAATGTRMFLRNQQTSTWNNNPSNRFPSVWNTQIEAEFVHPLLQGSGVQFNRIQGPGQNQALSTQRNPNAGQQASGVMIARTNMDIALAQFEAGVRNMVSDVERNYWDLYFQYRNLDAVVIGRDSALQTWRRVFALFQVGAMGGEAEKEAQAREQYFLFRGQVEGALSGLYTTENRLRYMMGLTATDGRLIRPADELTTAKVTFDWQEILPEALARSAELRQQKWTVQQRELQLIAAKNFLLPQLDLDALYRWRGFGDDLVNYQGQSFNPNVGSGPPDPNTNSGAWNTLWGGKFQESQVGLIFSMPLGFRQALAGVRNSQLNVARERALLQEQELALSHDLANALRDLDRHYAVSQTTFNRRVAAQKQVEAVKAAYDTNTVTLDLLLDAQRRLADAESSYFNSLMNYNVAILNVHFRKGSLLEYNGVYLAEGPWAGKAYFDARKRARERDAATYINYGYTRPTVLSRGPIPQETGTRNQLFQPARGNPTLAPTEEVPVGKPVPTGDGAPGMNSGEGNPNPTSTQLPGQASNSMFAPPALGGSAARPANGFDWNTVDLDLGDPTPNKPTGASSNSSADTGQVNPVSHSQAVFVSQPSFEPAVQRTAPPPASVPRFEGTSSGWVKSPR